MRQLPIAALAGVVRALVAVAAATLLIAASLAPATSAQADVASLSGVALTAPARANEVGAPSENFPQAVGCGGDGSCVAVGRFTPSPDDTGVSDLQVNVESNGVWGPGTTPSLPADASADSANAAEASLNAVACPAVGRCLAVGGYNVTTADTGVCRTGVPTVLAESWSGSGWTASEERAPGGDPCNRATADGVACASTAWCTAIGYMYDSSGKTYMWLGNGSVAGLSTSEAVPTPSSSTGEDGSEADIACASGLALCLATGIDDSAGGSDLFPNFVLVGTNGSWGRAQAIPTPATGDHDAALDSVACSPTLCYGSGTFTDAAGEERGLIVSTDGSGVWSATSPVAGRLIGMSCGAASCLATDWPSCVSTSTDCSLTAYTSQTGSWQPVAGPGATNTAYFCSREGPCFGRGLGSDVYALSGGVSTRIAQVQMPADCASEDDQACGDNAYPVVGCATSTCTWVQPYTTTAGATSAAAFTMSSPASTSPTTVQPRIALVCTPDPATAGATVTCTATVANPVAGSPDTPTGTVRIGTGGAGDPTCTLAPVGAGQASCQVSFAAPSAGTATLTARYSGDGLFAPGTASTTESVVEAPTGSGTTSSGSGSGSGSGPGVAVSKLKAQGPAATLTLSCRPGGGSCELGVKMTAKVSGGAAARTAARRTHAVVVGSAHLTIKAGHHRKVRVALTRSGRRLLAAHGRLRVTLTVSSATTSRPVLVRRLTLRVRHR